MYYNIFIIALIDSKKFTIIIFLYYFYPPNFESMRPSFQGYDVIMLTALHKHPGSGPGWTV